MVKTQMNCSDQSLQCLQVCQHSDLLTRCLFLQILTIKVPKSRGKNYVCIIPKNVSSKLYHIDISNGVDQDEATQFEPPHPDLLPVNSNVLVLYSYWTRWSNIEGYYNSIQTGSITKLY